METKYKLSNIIEIYPNENYSLIKNIITREKFKITLKSYEIIRFIKKNHTGISIKEISKKYNYIEKEELDNFYNFLITKKIIIDVNVNPKILTIPSYFSIFNHQQIDCEIVKHSIVYLGIPFGKGNTIDVNTHLYPDSIRKFTKKYCVENEISSNYPIRDVGNIYFYENEYTFISYLKIKKITQNLFKRNNKVFCLGGDHSITLPIIEGIQESYKSINIIHFDAHTDYYKSKIHDLHEENNFCCHHHGNFLDKIVQINNVNTIFQFGLRGVKEEEKHPSTKIKSFKINESKQFLNSLKTIDQSLPTYVTFDIDIIDPIFAPATSNPLIDGINIKNMLNLLNVIKCLNLNVIGIDLVEINPNKDIGNVTMQASVKIIKQLTKLLLNDE